MLSGLLSANYGAMDCAALKNVYQHVNCCDAQTGELGVMPSMGFNLGEYSQFQEEYQIQRHLDKSALTINVRDPKDVHMYGPFGYTIGFGLHNTTTGLPMQTDCFNQHFHQINAMAALGMTQCNALLYTHRNVYKPPVYSLGYGINHVAAHRPPSLESEHFAADIMLLYTSYLVRDVPQDVLTNLLQTSPEEPFVSIRRAWSQPDLQSAFAKIAQRPFSYGTLFSTAERTGSPISSFLKFRHQTKSVLSMGVMKTKNPYIKPWNSSEVASMLTTMPAPLKHMLGTYAHIESRESYIDRVLNKGMGGTAGNGIGALDPYLLQMNMTVPMSDFLGTNAAYIAGSGPGTVPRSGPITTGNDIAVNTLTGAPADDAQQTVQDLLVVMYFAQALPYKSSKTTPPLPLFTNWGLDAFGILDAARGDGFFQNYIYMKSQYNGPRPQEVALYVDNQDRGIPNMVTDSTTFPEWNGKQLTLNPLLFTSDSYALLNQVKLLNERVSGFSSLLMPSVAGGLDQPDAEFPSGTCTMSYAMSTFYRLMADDVPMSALSLFVSNHDMDGNPAPWGDETLYGELDKLADNICVGRLFKAVHFEVAMMEGRRVGELLAIGVFADMLRNEGVVNYGVSSTPLPLEIEYTTYKGDEIIIRPSGPVLKSTGESYLQYSETHKPKYD